MISSGDESLSTCDMMIEKLETFMTISMIKENQQRLKDLKNILYYHSKNISRVTFSSSDISDVRTTHGNLDYVVYLFCDVFGIKFERLKKEFKDERITDLIPSIIMNGTKTQSPAPLLSFIYHIVVNKNHLYFGETRDSKPDGFGYLLEKYYSGLMSRAYYGLIYAGEFSSSTSQLFEGKGRLFDGKEGLLLYEGQFKQGKRHGQGEEYDGVHCKRGKWKNGECVHTTSFFEFAQIDLKEIESQLTQENFLGKGANAVVYSVRWKRKQCAAKIIEIPRGTSYQLRERFVNKTRENLSLLASLSEHKNIIKIFGLIKDPENKKVGYLMQICKMDVNDAILEVLSSSSTVERKNSSCLLSMKDKLRYLHGAANGMKHLHSYDVMNRDLKWSNCLVDFSGEVVLTDLDTAKKDDSLWKISVQNTTDSIGTPVFLAPEITTEKYDKRMDIYSFGIMIYSLMFELVNPYAETLECPGCQLPIQEISRYDFTNHVKNHNLRPLVDFQKQRNLRDFGVEWILKLMKLCWSKDPSRRPSFDEIVYMLERKQNSMKDRIINLIVRGKDIIISKKNQPSSSSSFDHKLILIKKTYHALFSKIQSMFMGSKIVSLLVSKGFGGSEDVIPENVTDEEFVRILQLDQGSSSHSCDEIDIIVVFEEYPREAMSGNFSDEDWQKKYEEEEKRHKRTKKRVDWLEKQLRGTKLKFEEERKKYAEIISSMKRRKIGGGSIGFGKDDLDSEKMFGSYSKKKE